ncbi:MAG: hypothetical protein IGS03_10710 [Candidatus Sericytochromatia bacterium]|nr:hypothetical protein [Candidatus Sericytochromatia bacterium]
MSDGFSIGGYRLPTWSEIESLPRQAGEQLQALTGWGETPAAEAESPSTPETWHDSQSVPEAPQQSDFDPTVMRWPTPTQALPGPDTLIDGVVQLPQPVQPRDQAVLNDYAESRTQTRWSDAEVYLLENAGQASSYLPQAVQPMIQQPLSTRLDAAYQQAGRDSLASILNRQAGEGFSSLPAEQQARVLDVLSHDGLSEAMLPEVQGLGGEAARTGTASGTEGHYVNSPVASMAELLRQGKVDDEVLSALEDLRQYDSLDPALRDEGEALFNSTLQNIAFPTSISQRSKGTCAAARAEMLLAMDDPAAYARTAQRLASPSGRARVNSAFLPRVPGTEQAEQSGRSVASRLIQPAMMEYANGYALDYDNARDLHQQNGSRGETALDGSGGLRLEESQRLLTGLFGDERVQPARSIFDQPASSRAEVLQHAQESLTAGQQPVVVDLDWGTNRQGGDSGHALLLTHLDDQQAYLLNPWGEQNTIPRADFEARLRSAVSLDPPPALPPEAQDLSAYTALTPERYLRSDQLLRFNIQEHLAQIQEPALRQSVERYVDQGLSIDQMGELLPLLSGYVKAQDTGNDIESEREYLLMILPN